MVRSLVREEGWGLSSTEIRGKLRSLIKPVIVPRSVMSVIGGGRGKGKGKGSGSGEWDQQSATNVTRWVGVSSSFG